MTNTAKHTPGPWTVTGVSMTTGNISVGMKEHRIVIAEVTNAASFGDMLAGAMRRGGGGFEQGDCHTQHANASLIAASPDLLEALRNLHRATDLRSLRGLKHVPSMREQQNAMLAASAAIAKAEGRPA